VAVEPIDLERLRAADEVFVTSSIRGRQRVCTTFLSTFSSLLHER
jgi:branched-subunit amino acid aminotransferase/4-amino-4-deoxychorismate lyase